VASTRLKGSGTPWGLWANTPRSASVPFHVTGTFQTGDCFSHSVAGICLVAECPGAGELRVK
jgi:hypothetical protein